MNFDVSEEQQLLQETVRQYLANECPLPRVREIFEGEGHDPAFWKGLMEMGVGGLHLPEEHGGAGLEMIDLALVTETLGYGGAPGPFFGHALAGLALALAGSDEQKQTWLPRLATGEALGSVAFAEVDGGWQPEQWTLAPGKKLSGTKLHVPYATLADVVIVGVAGGGLALVESTAKGFEAAPIESIDRARRIGAVVLDETPGQTLPGGEAAAPRVRDAGLVLLAADAFGVGTRLVDMCVEYAKTREQFGVTVGHIHALKHQLAGMEDEI